MAQTSAVCLPPIETKGMVAVVGKITKVANSQKSLSRHFTVNREIKSDLRALMQAAAPLSLIMMLKLPCIIVKDVKVKKEPTNTMVFALPIQMQLPRQQIFHLTKILEKFQQGKSQMTFAPLLAVLQKQHKNKK